MIGQNGALPSGKARALAREGVDISSNSWGAFDYRYAGPSQEEIDAMHHGVTKVCEVKLFHGNQILV